eukprot:SAG11_NODE_22252_length_409_cov_1.267742_1_plen_80_part_01
MGLSEFWRRNDKIIFFLMSYRLPKVLSDVHGWHASGLERRIARARGQGDYIGSNQTYILLAHRKLSRIAEDTVLARFDTE